MKALQLSFPSYFKDSRTSVLRTSVVLAICLTSIPEVYYAVWEHFVDVHVDVVFVLVVIHVWVAIVAVVAVEV